MSFCCVSNFFHKPSRRNHNKLFVLKDSLTSNLLSFFNSTFFVFKARQYFLEIKIWFSSVLYTKIRPDDIFYIGPINLSTLL